MFNLEKAIAEWRRELAWGRRIDPESLDELESHLRDAIDSKMNGGAAAEFAFREAITELGEASALQIQFQISTYSSRRAQMVKWSALALVAVSALFTALYFSPRDAQKIIGVSVALGVFLLFLAKFIAAMRFKNAEPDLSNLSPAGRSVIDFAKVEARRFHHSYLGTEHLLLGICKEVPNLVESVGLNPLLIQTEIEKVIDYSDNLSPANADSLVFTPRAKGILAIAGHEQNRFHQPQTLPEHLLLGVLLYRSGLARQVLQHLGVDMESARQRLEDQMRKG